MAIKSSGQLSLRDDIRAEFGGSTSNVSLRDQASRAGLGTPDAMSEFYGLSSRTNDYHYEGRRGYLDTSVRAPSAQNLGLGMTFIGWFRVNSVVRKNQLLFSFGNNPSSPRGTVFANYLGSLNRISCEVRDSNGTRRLRRQFPLHDSRNRGITGVTSSGTGWQRSQRGNVDSNGFCQLAFTVDTSQSSYTGIQFYWNGQPLSYSVNNVNSGIFLGNQVLPNHLGVANFHWNGDTGNIFEGGIDNVAFFNYVMDSGTIQSLYNEGNWFMGDIIGGSPAPVFANGLEGDLTNQVINNWGYGVTMRGYTYSLTNAHPAGYP